jgi:4-amino-4-deoxy-L-arabinose transferase-like glycosyltransferase
VQRISPRLVLLAAAGVFLLVSYTADHHWDEYYYLYSVSHHTLSELLVLDATGTVMAPGYFTLKAGFVVFLNTLVGLLGKGFPALEVIQLVFAALIVAWVIVSYLLLKNILSEGEALASAVTLMFLPVSVYLGYKVLAEAPSLLLATAGCWQFLESFRTHRGWSRAGRLGFAVVALFLGILCRFVAVLLLPGLVLGLLVLRDERFPRKTVLARAGVVAAAMVPLFLAAAVAGLQYALPLNLLRFTLGKTSGFLLRPYAWLMLVQLFLLVLPFALRRPWSNTTRFAVTWLLACTLPLASAHESRYLYLGLIPLSILVTRGVKELARLTGPRAGYLRWAALMGAIVLANRWMFHPLMPYSFNQRELATLMQETTKRYSGATYLAPFSVHYCFLAFAFPAERFRLVALVHSPEESTGFLRWIGEDKYVGSLDSLHHLPTPWIYVSDRHNLSVERVNERVRAVGFRTVVGSADHRTLSWIWSDPRLALVPVGHLGHFFTFEVRLRGD